MATPLVVGGDQVKGTDTHHVTGPDTSTPPVTYVGTGDYAYRGAVTEKLSAFVRIDGVPLALVTSGSTLDPGQEAPPDGGHAPGKGDNFQPKAPAPNKELLKFVDTPLGAGAPSAGAGSRVLSVAGVRVLLDGDAFDTCGPLPTAEGSRVTASQTYVTCTE